MHALLRALPAALSLLAPLGAGELPIAPLAQPRPGWCWAATAEMVLRHAGVAAPRGVDLQLGIAARLNRDCPRLGYACTFTQPDLPILRLLLAGYAQELRKAEGKGPLLSALVAASALGPEQLRREIDGSRPVVAWIAPPGFPAGGQPQHVALVVGYDADEEAPKDPWLVVNDPYPYGAPGQGKVANPYLAGGGEETQAGQYSIKYSRFQRELRWSQSLFGIEGR